jgi:peptide/nickel transport system substrate-binding protein
VEEQNTHIKNESMKRTILARLTLLPSPLKIVFAVALFVFLGTSFSIGAKLIDERLVEIPRHGGMLTEGIIGRPRFINPVIAKSDADRDMTALVYSGLLRPTPEGELIPDLASAFTISEDGLTYTFTLKDGIVWHDGVAITSDDIAFTVSKVRDIGLAIKSPRRAGWEGVDVSTPDPMTIVFKLKQPYAQFLENTTMGIIPKHIWQNVPDEEFDVSYYNIDPIGSGPYRVKGLVRDSEGLPRYYDLTAFKRYRGGEPYITNLRMQFFGNNDELAQAYSDQRIDQMHALTPEAGKALESAGRQVAKTPLPRIFAFYFNQNQQPVLVDKAVREALNLAVDKDMIVAKVLDGYGKTIDGPLPFLEMPATTTPTLQADRIAQAKSILEKAGWTKNAANIYEKVDKKKKTVTLLQFSVALPDVPELRNAAELAKSDWQKLGADVTIKVFEQSSFAGDVLSPRKYDVLLYGQIIGRDPDPYPYWHSSQRNAPGLNVALYANKNVDKLLENARKESDLASRDILLTQFVEAIDADTPAIFLYSPDFLYATANKVHGIDIGLITTESERFIGIENWYIQSERVWKMIAERMKRVP